MPLDLLVIAAVVVGIGTLVTSRSALWVKLLSTAFVLGLLVIAAPALALVYFFGSVVLEQQAQGASEGEPRVGSAEIRYLFSVTFKIDGRLITSSAVQGLAIHNLGFSGAGTLPAARTSFSGNALVLPIEGGPTLFVLMVIKSADDYGNFYLRNCNLKRGDESMSTFLGRVAAFDQQCPVSADGLPMIVSLADRDPSTATVVGADKLSEAFGRNIEFVSANLKRTSAPLSEGIQNKFSWLGESDRADLNDTSRGQKASGAHLYKYWFYGLDREQ